MINGMTCGNVVMKCASNMSDLTRASFKTILTQLSDFSPSDALLNAHLCQDDGIYRASVEIHSSELNIAIEKKAGSIVSLLGDLKHDLMDQIIAWRKMRTVESHSA